MRFGIDVRQRLLNWVCVLFSFGWRIPCLKFNNFLWASSAGLMSDSLRIVGELCAPHKIFFSAHILPQCGSGCQILLPAILVKHMFFKMQLCNVSCGRLNCFLCNKGLLLRHILKHAAGAHTWKIVLHIIEPFSVFCCCLSKPESIRHQSASALSVYIFTGFEVAVTVGKQPCKVLVSVNFVVISNYFCFLFFGFRKTKYSQYVETCSRCVLEWSLTVQKCLAYGLQPLSILWCKDTWQTFPILDHVWLRDHVVGLSSNSF